MNKIWNFLEMKVFYRFLSVTIILTCAFVQIKAEAPVSPTHSLEAKVIEPASRNQDGKRISGTVVDTNNEPIIGANIVVKGTTNGIISDLDGQFELTVPNNAVLEISYIGYISQEIAVSNRTTFNIILKEDAIGLEEVVAIGYGTVKKSDLTGAISSLSADRLMDKPTFNVAQALSGKVAGVKIVERSGAPGGRAMIRIRGTNSINSGNDPLVVVDGVVGLGDALSTMNPSEIQSMEVLKDASATAIYGARGANGVIMITTKRGTDGSVQVEYDGSATGNFLQKHLNNLNAEQFLYTYTQAWMNVAAYGTPSWGMCLDGSLQPADYTGKTYADYPHLFEKTSAGGYSIPLRDKQGNYYKPRFDTNWEKETFKPSVSTNHQVNVRGGNDKMKLGAFLNYSRDAGLLNRTYFERYSGRLTADFKVSKWLEVNSSLLYNRTKESLNDASYFSGGMGRAVVEAFPILPLMYPNDPSIYGSYAGQYARNADFPVGETDPQAPYEITKTSERLQHRSQMVGNLAFTIHLLPELDFKTTLSIDDRNNKYNEYGGIRISRGDHGYAYIGTNKYTEWQNENYFTYNKTFGGVHALTAMLGASWSRYNYEDFNISNNTFFDDFYMWHNIGVGTKTRPSPSSGDGQNSINSYYLRANYVFNSRYTVTVTGRYDGSSRFGENNKYGFFPSGAVSWRISEEGFAKDIEHLSNLKLRLSAGETGNQEIGRYVTQGFIGSTNVPINGAVQSGLYPNSMANPDLKWERTLQYDAGLDFGLFDSRIMASVDYYYKKTMDMVLDVPLPISTTTGSVKQNYGSVENKGFEVTLNTHNVKSRDFNWYTDIAFTANRNKILQLGPTGADILRNGWVGGSNTVLREGSPIASFWGMNRLGTYTTEEASLAAKYNRLPGDLKYEDRNNDGRIDFSGDGYLIGSAFPKGEIDFNNRFDYKNFDLSIDIHASYGAKMQNRTNHSGEDRQTMGNSKVTVMNAWRPDYQTAPIAQVKPGMGGARYDTYPDTHWIEDASYIRGEGIAIGYTVPSAFVHKLGLSSLRLYLSGRNFFCLDKYQGYDPEASDNDNMDGLTPHMDFYSYPRPMSYTFGVNLKF
ncbi:MAG: TonB-dependent receptor [Tannerella sp.]|jgi:TonB-linked SusC/RagA family outer membrane protein|nr:TonB-dependent receptor [Tannerella sp.]